MAELQWRSTAPSAGWQTVLNAYAERAALAVYPVRWRLAPRRRCLTTACSWRPPPN